MKLEYWLVLALFWVIAALVLFAQNKYSQPPRGLSARWLFAVICAIALGLRLVPDLLLPVGAVFDIESYRIVAKLLASGQDVYSAAEAAGRHPYLPLQMYWMLAAYKFSLASGWSFTKIVRLLPIASDALIAGMVFVILRWKRSEAEAWRGGLLYALNPVTILVCAYHGQFDAVPVLFILLAWWCWKSFSKRGMMLAATLSAICLGAGILDKGWPVLFLPIVLGQLPQWRLRVYYLALVVAVPLAGLVVYLSDYGGVPWAILMNAAGYNHGVGIWGYTYLVRLGLQAFSGLAPVFGWLFQNGRWLTLAVLGGVYVCYARRQPAMAGFLSILLAFFAFGHAFSIQYLAWLVPFAVLGSDWVWLRRYCLAACAYMFLAYFTLIFIFRIDYWLPGPQADMYLIMPAGIPVWLVTVAWCLSQLRLTERAYVIQPLE